MKAQEEIDSALKILSTAKSRWDYEEKQGPLWSAAQNHPKELVQTFYLHKEHQLSIAWCLANVRNSTIKDFFIKESRNKDQYIRWYAIVNLRKYNSSDLVEIFIQGLKDRSSLVKGESLKAVTRLKDERIRKALKHLVTLKSFKEHSPGDYDQAKLILKKTYKII